MQRLDDSGQAGALDQGTGVVITPDSFERGLDAAVSAYYRVSSFRWDETDSETRGALEVVARAFLQAA